jgi:hypothetical protein
MRRFWIAALASQALIGAWPAAAFDHICPAAGTEVWTTLIPASGRPIRYDGQDGLWCQRSRGGQPTTSELGHIRFFARNAMDTDIRGKFLDAAQQLWPLTPGTNISFLYATASDGSSEGATQNNTFYRGELSVEFQRQIAVPAGTFSVIPIVYTIRGQQGNYHQSSYTYYYAPELGANVKFEYRLISGSSFDQAKSWELTRIRQPSGTGGDSAGGGEG